MLFDYKTLGLQDYKTSGLQDFRTARLQDFMTSGHLEFWTNIFLKIFFTGGLLSTGFFLPHKSFEDKLEIIRSAKFAIRCLSDSHESSKRIILVLFDRCSVFIIELSCSTCFLFQKYYFFSCDAKLLPIAI
jgi:hypothetical protein